MKKRLLLTILLALLLANIVLAAPPTKTEGIISDEKPLEGKSIVESPVQDPTLGEGIQRSNIQEATTNSGAKFKSSLSLGGLLKTFINGIILAESFTDLLIPDSIQIINPTFITYNTIQNYILIDSAEAIKLLEPFEMQLNNLGKTKIQLNSQNEVQNIETQFKTDQEQTFNSPFNNEDSFSIKPKANSDINLTIKDFKDEKNLTVQGNTNITIKNKQSGSKTIFTIKRDTIIISEDDGYYTVEGKNEFSEFQSGFFKQFLENSVKVNFNSQFGFSKINFLKNGYFIQEFSYSKDILQEDSSTFARSFKISSNEEFNLYLATNDKDTIKDFESDKIKNKAYVNLFTHQILLKGILNYERISAEISDNSFLQKGKNVREIKIRDFKYKKIIESKNLNNFITIDLDENNLFLNATIELNLNPKDKEELFRLHTDSLSVYELPTEITTKTSRFADFDYEAPNVLKGFKTNIYIPEIVKKNDKNSGKDITQQTSISSNQKLYSVLENSRSLFLNKLKEHPEGFLECQREMNVKDDVLEKYSPLIPLLPLIFFLPLSFLRKKRGNVSLFVFIGIIIITILAVTAYITNNIRTSTKVPDKLTAIQDAIDGCYEKTLKCGVYYFTVKSDVLIAKDLKYPKEILESFIKRNVNKCIKSLKEPNILINEPDKVTVFFNKGIEVKAEQGIVGINSLKGNKLINFKADSNLKLKDIYNLMKYIKTTNDGIPISLLADLGLDAEIYDLGQKIIYVIVGESGVFDNSEYAFVFSKQRTS